VTGSDRSVDPRSYCHHCQYQSQAL